jgi:hypothetical protein
VDVLAVERGDEGRVELDQDLVGQLVALGLQLLDLLGDRLTVGWVGGDQRGELVRRVGDDLGGLDEQWVEAALARGQSDCHTPERLTEYNGSAGPAHSPAESCDLPPPPTRDPMSHEFPWRQPTVQRAATYQDGREGSVSW